MPHKHLIIKKHENLIDVLNEVEEKTNNAFLDQSWEKVSSGFASSDTIQLLIPHTFRFQYTLELYDRGENYEAIFFVPKSSRTHEYFYDEAINSLNFRTPSIADALTAYVQRLCDKGIAEIVEDPIQEEEAKDPESTSIKFTFDMNFVTAQGLQVALNKTEQTNIDLMVFEKIINEMYNSNDMVLSVLTAYAKEYKPQWVNSNDELEKFKLESMDMCIEMLSTIKKMPLFKSEHLIKTQEYKQSLITKIKKSGLHKNIIIDKHDYSVYQSSFGSHYSTLIEIIAVKYFDSFQALDQKEKDEFIMSNFELIGTYYNSKSTYYTPKDDALGMYGRKAERNCIELKAIPIIEFWNDIVAQMTIANETSR